MSGRIAPQWHTMENFPLANIKWLPLTQAKTSVFLSHHFRFWYRRLHYTHTHAYCKQQRQYFSSRIAEEESTAKRIRIKKNIKMSIVFRLSSRLFLPLLDYYLLPTLNIHYRNIHPFMAGTHHNVVGRRRQNGRLDPDSVLAYAKPKMDWQSPVRSFDRSDGWVFFSLSSLSSLYTVWPVVGSSNLLGVTPFGEL